MKATSREIGQGRSGARPAGSSARVRLNRAVYWLSRHWLLVFLAVWGVFNLLPWLAPVFMEAGWDTGGRAIYTVYLSSV